VYTLNSSSCSRASAHHPAAPCSSPPRYFLALRTLSDACLLASNQLLGAAGPDGDLAPVRRALRIPGFGAGGSVSAICRRRRNSGGTVRCVTRSVISFLLSAVALGASSRRNCCMRSLTVWGGGGVDADAFERERELWSDGCTSTVGFVRV
jgi:hypothetical protein